MIEINTLSTSKNHDIEAQKCFVHILHCSLEGRFADEELGGLLEDIQTKRSFQY